MTPHTEESPNETPARNLADQAPLIGHRREPVCVVYIVTSPISAWIFLEGHLQHLRERGYTVHLISSPGELLDRVGSREGIQVHPLAMEREISPLKDLVSLVKLYRTIRRLRPEITHVGTPKAGLLGGLACLLARVPARVYTLHGLRLEGANGVRRLVLVAMEWISCHLAHVVVCVSPSLRTRAVGMRLVAAARALVLANGSTNGVSVRKFSTSIARSEAAQQAAAKFGIVCDAPVLGYVGRLTRAKGIAELCKAHEQLRLDHPAVQLLLVGWIEEADGLAEETRSYLSGTAGVYCTGFVEDVAPFYALMDILVLATYREGFPTAPLEAAAAGLPVVTTKATGAIDSVVDGVTGILVDAGNVPQLVAALHRLLEQPGLGNEMGAQGLRRVEEQFSSERLWEATDALYQRMLDA